MNPRRPADQPHGSRLRLVLPLELHRRTCPRLAQFLRARSTEPVSLRRCAHPV